MKKAIVIDGVVAACVTVFTSAVSFTPPQGSLVYDAGDEVESGWIAHTAGDGSVTFTAPEVVEVYQQVTPMTFLMLFTFTERIALKKLVNGDPDADPVVKPDPLIVDWWGIITDVRLVTVDLNLPSVQQALGYLVMLGILTQDRLIQILEAKIQ